MNEINFKTRLIIPESFDYGKRITQIARQKGFQRNYFYVNTFKVLSQLYEIYLTEIFPKGMDALSMDFKIPEGSGYSKILPRYCELYKMPLDQGHNFINEFLGEILSSDFDNQLKNKLNEN